jgi:hypothetical protein
VVWAGATVGNVIFGKRVLGMSEGNQPRGIRPAAQPFTLSLAGVNAYSVRNNPTSLWLMK